MKKKYTIENQYNTWNHLTKEKQMSSYSFKK